jgi:adenylosuccinate synthase
MQVTRWSLNNIKHVLHNIPSGVFHPGCINVIGNGVVIDPIVFADEIHSLEKLGVNLKNLSKYPKKHT